jgi:hypothetical protein
VKQGPHKKRFHLFLYTKKRQRNFFLTLGLKKSVSLSTGGSMLKRKWFYLILGFFILLTGQQCAKVDLEFHEEVRFLSLSPNPLRLDPPVENEHFRRIIFLVDMSYSTVSGPCPQDINESISDWVTPFTVYDPNKNLGNPDDHRADGIDCIIDPSLDLKRSSVTLSPQPNIQSNPRRHYKTHLGMDYEKRRFKILRDWIHSARTKNVPSLVKNTQIMVIPVSGGLAQEYLETKWKELTKQNSLVSFFDLQNPQIDQIIQWLETEHDNNLEAAMADDILRYKDQTLGTSTPGSYLSSIYRAVQTDMRSQNSKGHLAFTDYQVVSLTTGHITPLKEHMEKVLRFYSPCSSCAANPKTCDKVSSLCHGLANRLEEVWGLESQNSLTAMDNRLGLLQALPFHFGNGLLKVDFVHLNKDRYSDVYPNKKPFTEDLEPLFKKRHSKMGLWSGNSDTAPFRLVGESSLSASFKVTDFYLLNLNYRMSSAGHIELDSDGDGVSDAREKELGLDPQNPRSNGYVLDLFLANTSFKDRAEALTLSNSCDPFLDSDGDSLNECEEILLGTDQFDFDTDGDGIPDSWEILYGLNPLAPDTNLDSNGDGITNKIAFNLGVPPQPLIKNLPESGLSRYEVNYQGKEQVSHPQFGNMLVELYEIIVKGLPVAEGLVSKTPPSLFRSRAASDALTRKNNEIPHEEQLFSIISDVRYNTLTALARVISVTEPDRVFWRIYKTQIPLSNIYSQPQLDLSLFKQIKVRDPNENK